MKRMLRTVTVSMMAILLAFTTVSVADNNVKDSKKLPITTKESVKTDKPPKTEKLMNELLKLYAREEKIDLEDDQLELDYKSQKLNITAYRSQKAALDKREIDVEDKIEAVKRELKSIGFTSDDWLSLNAISNKLISNVSKANQPKVDKLLAELKELYVKEDGLDSKEDSLEFFLKLGHTNFSSYKTQMKDIKVQEDALEIKEKEIKFQLKQLGYYSSVIDDDMYDDDMYDDDMDDDNFHDNDDWDD